MEVVLYLHEIQSKTVCLPVKANCLPAGDTLYQFNEISGLTTYFTITYHSVTETSPVKLFV